MFARASPYTINSSNTKNNSLKLYQHHDMYRVWFCTVQSLEYAIPCHKADEQKVVLANTNYQNNNLHVAAYWLAYDMTKKTQTNSVINHSSLIPIATAGEFSMVEGAREGASMCLTIAAVSLGPLILPSLLLASHNWNPMLISVGIFIRALTICRCGYFKTCLQRVKRLTLTPQS